MENIYSVNQSEVSLDQLQTDLAKIALRQKYRLPDPEISAHNFEQACLETFQTLFPNIDPNLKDQDLFKELAKRVSTNDEEIRKDTLEITTQAGEVIRSPRDYVQKWSYFPELIKEFQTYNCSGAGSITTAYLRSLEYEAYLTNVVGHVTTLIKNGDEYSYLDPRNGFVQELDIEKVVDFPSLPFVILKLAKPVSGYHLVPYYRDFNQGYNEIHASNHKDLLLETKSKDLEEANASKFVIEHLKQNNLFNVSASLVRMESKRDLEKTESWKAEVKSLNLSEQVEKALGKLIEFGGLNELDLSVFLAKGKDFIIDFLTVRPEELESFLKKENFSDAPKWIEARGVFWQETENIRNISFNDFRKSVVEQVESKINL